MKKNILVSLLATLTIITGCGGETKSSENKNSSSLNGNSSSNINSSQTPGDNFKKDTNLKIITPTGAPTLGMLNYIHDNDYETNTTPANIIASMNTGTYDIVVVDTIGGMNAISKGAEYKMAATLTFGNYYIYSTGNDDNGIMENGDNIISFGKNQTPDKLFNYLFPDLTITEYVAGVADTSPVACAGAFALEDGLTDVDYVFMAEPVMFAMMSNKTCATNLKGSKYMNIQEEFKKKNNESIISGAAIFVKNSTYETKESEVLEVLNNIKSNVNEIIDNPILAKQRIESLGDQNQQKARIGIASGAAYNVLLDNNSVGLGYTDYTDETWISKVNGYYTALGMVTPSETQFISK